MRGGEKCLEVFCELFPEAALFTLLHRKGSVSPVIEGMDIRTSFLQKIPGICRHYRNFLPLFTVAIERFDLSGYDLVLSSSHCVAKGARKPDGALHICYCYTPARYAWKFFNTYFAAENPVKRRVIAYVMDRFRKWDLGSNKKVDHFLAISDNVRKRIKEFYSRDADVIYPPVHIVPGSVRTDPGKNAGRDTVKNGQGYYLIVSAMVPYKCVDLAIKAFNRSGRRLVIIGTGSDLPGLRKSAADNVTFLGWAGEKELGDHYSGCAALVFPGEEDFGIVPVEAQSYGKPVIAYGRGGVLETVIPLREHGRRDNGESPTGVFFHEQTVEALNHAIDRFEKNRRLFKPGRLRENALRFNRDRFKREIRDYIEAKLEIHANT
ncbi:MAG: glycosyltransferase [Candidatus Omnitrophica bacterium]|nr:glycosyltransferase [Candidatus Omnitrophota bacterium]